MSQPNDIPNPFDPLGFWRTTQNASLDSWSKAMIELVNTDAYAEATGRMLDTYLSASLPMRKVVEQAMAQVLGPDQRANARRGAQHRRAYDQYRDAPGRPRCPIR